MLRHNTPAEVNYYRFATTSEMKAAYDFATASEHAAAGQPGGCGTGMKESGKWSVAGVAVGDITCTAYVGNGADLIWDDPTTKIIAVASSRYLLPATLYAFWRSSGASIHGSAGSARSA